MSCCSAAHTDISPWRKWVASPVSFEFPGFEQDAKSKTLYRDLQTIPMKVFKGESAQSQGTVSTRKRAERSDAAMKRPRKEQASDQDVSSCGNPVQKTRQKLKPSLPTFPGGLMQAPSEVSGISYLDAEVNTLWFRAAAAASQTLTTITDRDDTAGGASLHTYARETLLTHSRTNARTNARTYARTHTHTHTH